MVLFPEETKAAIECLLFVTKEPLPLKVICEICELDKLDAETLLQELVDEYQERKRGLQIIEIAGGYQLCTKQDFAHFIERLYRPQSSYGLSKAALETLAIIAYKQPITRGEIEMIRGVKVDRAITTLTEKNLIKVMGRKEGPGRPVLFGTTEDFLKHFGLNHVKDLPNPEEFFVESIGEDEADSEVQHLQTEVEEKLENE